MFQNRVRIFPPKLENIFFSFLSFFFVLALLSVFGIWSLPVTLEPSVSLMAKFLFFNSTHVFFTLLLMVYLPEFRRLIVRKVKSKSGFLIIGAFIFICFCLYWKRFLLQPNPSLILFADLVLGTLLVIHNLAQSKGLALLYNHYQKSSLDETSLKTFMACEKRERLLFNVFLLVQSLKIIFFLTMPEYHELILKCFAVTGCALSAGIFANSFLFPKNRKTNKRFYLLSLFFYPFADLIPLILLIQMAVHGMEYTFLAIGMSQKSKFQPSRKTLMGIGFMVMTVTVVFFLQNRFVTSTWTQIPTQFIVVGAALNFVMTFFHYFLDGILFRMKDPVVREQISDLLKETTAVSDMQVGTIQKVS